MKPSFQFDGNILTLKLRVEDKQEQAIAALLELYSVSSVAVEYEQYRHGYSDGIKAINFLFRKPAGEMP